MIAPLMASHRWSDGSLADIMPAALQAMGVHGFTSPLEFPSANRVVVLLVDGLGHVALNNHRDLLPSISSAREGVVTAAFPTTTPTGLATLGTGSLPGHHGFVGASFWLPDVEQELHPLHWGSSPLPGAVQPEPTVFERASRAGVRCASIGPAAYEGSGLTHSVLRGSTYVAAESVTDRLDALDAAWASKSSVPHLAYMYWAPLDRVGHESGVGSNDWCSALEPVDALIEGVHRMLRSGDTLVVTADHGMVNVPPQNRAAVDDVGHLWAHVRTMLGEPRMRHLYVSEPDRIDDVQKTWQDFLGDRADVRRREDVITDAWWGDVEPGVEDRAGDLLVISRTDHSVASMRHDARVSSLIGQHGALTRDELLVPALVLSADI